jgi:hypothetical protein
VWLHVSISDAAGRVVFESGALRTDGSIAGNDNDADGSAFEPHHSRIDDSEKVQIYETVMADHAGRVTTGLLSAVRFIKDNRILPLGFAKETAPGEVAVQGGAREDHDFVGGSDRVEYVAMTTGVGGPYKVVAELWYQPIAFRWAHNLGAFDSMEPRRFVEYFGNMAAESAVMLARAEARVAGSGSGMAP